VVMEVSSVAHGISRRAVAGHEEDLPPVLARLQSHFQYLAGQITEITSEMTQQLSEDEMSSRLLKIPGVGTFIASVRAVEPSDARQFASSRQFVALVGWWVRTILMRRLSSVVACALANKKLARIAWAILAKGHTTNSACLT